MAGLRRMRFTLLVAPVLSSQAVVTVAKIRTLFNLFSSYPAMCAAAGANARRSHRRNESAQSSALQRRM